MQISKIYGQNFLNYNNKNISTPRNLANTNNSEPSYAKVPVGFRYGVNIHFGAFFDPNRKVPDIDYEEYMMMNPNTKRRFRRRYQSYGKMMNKEEMFDKKEAYMPLNSERNMDEFIKTSKIYNKYKDQPIICLGRSPKWFLNAALWMKDGIDDYKFVAFSKYWFYPHPAEGVQKIPNFAPTEKETAAYRKYLKRISATPQNIVDHYNKTGQKTVITDFIATGKGVTSFLDFMAEYADEEGILEEFSKAIQIVGIGSMTYMEDLQPYADEISIPHVIMPPKLRKYTKNIKQEFYNMDYPMFREMLMNQNTNECRSTYYPHNAWTVYKPDKFKTGLVKDMKKVKEIVKTLGTNKSMASFTPAMGDYRNLLNFRILDALSQRGLLKEEHTSKI